MGRFSPTVRPTSQPGGLGSLAQALQAGVEGYRTSRDRAEARLDRERKRTIETDTLATQGITPRMPTAQPSFVEALMGQGEVPTPEPTPPVPGALMPSVERFQVVDPVTGQPRSLSVSPNALRPQSRVTRLPSGGTFDPTVMEQRAAGMKLATGRADNTVEQEGRQVRQGELAAALQAIGAPVAPAVQEGAAQSYLQKPVERAPVMGSPEWYAAQDWLIGKRGAEARATKGTATGGTGRLSVSVQQDLQSIESSIPQIQRAIDLVNSSPDAFGPKNLMGPMLSDARDKMLNPEGTAQRRVQARSSVENIVAQIRHSLYGAALTRPEIQRALTNLPDVRQFPELAVVRLQELLYVLNNERAAISRSVPQMQGVLSGPSGSPQGTPVAPRRQFRLTNPD